MTNHHDNIDLVKRMNNAAEKKNFETMKAMLHPQYSFKDPMLELHSPEEFIAFMKNCPSDCRVENVSFISEGNKVVQILDVVMTSPFSFQLHMCDVLTIEDGKIRSEEVFYDTAKIPEEAKNMATMPPQKISANL